MSSIDALAAEQSGKPDPIEAAEQMTALFDLPSLGLTIIGARVVGRGSQASADIYLNNGSEISFESMRDLAKPQRLMVEIAACTGATPKLTQAQAIRAVALIRALAEHERVVGDDERAVEWGVTFLQAASVVDVDINDQQQRWAAFVQLESSDPQTVWHQRGVPIAKSSTVLHDRSSGQRLVRTGWFRAHVRGEDHTVSPQDIAHRMQRVGWRQPGSTGRIKATRPGLPGTLAWSFYVVPKGWEDER